MDRNLGISVLLFSVGCGGGPGAGQKSATEQPSQPDPAVEAGKYAKDPGLLRKKAEEFWQKHQYKEAVAFLEPIVKAAPDSAEA